MNPSQIWLMLLFGIGTTSALKCYECANLKGRINTCTTAGRTITESNPGSEVQVRPNGQRVGVSCRTFTYGGVVVGQGMVTSTLCGPGPLSSSRIVIRRAFNGEGAATDAFCCDTDLCNANSAGSESANLAVAMGLVGLVLISKKLY